MKIVLLTSGLPRIFRTPVALMAGQLQLTQKRDVVLLGLFWDAPPIPNFDALKALTPKIQLISKPPEKLSLTGFERKRDETNIANVLSMNLARKLLLEHLEKISPQFNQADTIFIYLRTDSCLTGRIDLNQYANEVLHRDVMYVPLGGNWHQGWSDQFAIGNYKTMRIYLSLYDSIRAYYANDRVEFHPETLLKHHLKTNSVEVKPLKVASIIFRSDVDMVPHVGVVGFDNFTP